MLSGTSVFFFQYLTREGNIALSRHYFIEFCWSICRNASLHLIMSPYINLQFLFKYQSSPHSFTNRHSEEAEENFQKSLALTKWARFPPRFPPSSLWSWSAWRVPWSPGTVSIRCFTGRYQEPWKKDSSHHLFLKFCLIQISSPW